MRRICTLAAAWAALAAPVAAESTILFAEQADLVVIARETPERRLARVRIAPGAPARFEVFGAEGVGVFAVGPKGELIAHVAKDKVEKRVIIEERDALVLLDRTGQRLGEPVASSLV